jgi:4-amino-4-deoxy-L-arabinose transferase-like glycosyltransferase
MDKTQTQKQNPSRSLPATLQHLFIPGRDATYIYWLLGAITLIGMIIRIWRMSQPIAYDEAYTFIHYASREFKYILADYSAPNNHILNTILIRLLYDIFGRQVWVVRGPALLAGILCIPAGYFAARRIFDPQQALAGAALIAMIPWFINYSINGRGYTMVTFFSLLLANLGALLVERQSRAALTAYVLVAALGFYTIPIFLYPMAGVSLWVLVSHLISPGSKEERSIRVRDFLAACLIAGLFTLLLYLPVILFGTGFASIASNEIVESRAWSVFLENVRPRAVKTWESWMTAVAPATQYVLLGGFLISLFFYRKASRQRLPLQVFLILGAAIMLVIQRVAPLARVWMYLESFYLIFAAGGLIWLVELVLNRLNRPAFTARMISAIILLGVMILGTRIYLDTQQGSVVPNQGDFPEQHAAQYLATHLQKDDTILSVSPVDIQTAYYLYMYGVPYDVFYQRDHPVQVRNAVVVLRRNSKYNSPETVLDYYNLTGNFDLAAARLLYQYGPLLVYSIPAQ